MPLPPLLRRITQPILDLLTQGITPEKIALSLALGIAFGVFPMLGTTTLLCTLIAVPLRLNLPALQLVNYLMYPVQIALLIPFIRFGEWLWNAPRLPLSLSQILAMVRTDAWHAITLLWHSTMLAVSAWLLAAPFFIAAFYLVTVPVLRYAASQMNKKATPTTPNPQPET